MKTRLLTCLLFFLSHACYAQEKIPEFGNIDPADLRMTQCVFEKGAAAMNLIKTAKISMEINEYSGNPTLTFEYRVRIKIFNKQGFPAANIRIPYRSRDRSTRIKDIEAFIYSLDNAGKVTREKVAKKEIFNDRSKAANAVNYVSFTFPDLTDGVVIEYKYTRVDKNSLHVLPWFFQDDLPTAISRVVTDIPAVAYLTYRIIGYEQPEKDSTFKKHYNYYFNEDIRSFTRRNIHSFRAEPLMYSITDNMERVEFSVAPSSFLHSSFLSNEAKMKAQSYYLLGSRFFGHQCQKQIPGAGRLIDSVKKLASKEVKVAALYQYLQKNVEYNGEQTFFCDSVEGCWSTRSGTSAELNILFLNLLRKAGVGCMPLLISTHENGNPDPDFPSLSQFDGVDVLIRDTGLNYVVDCTQKELSYKIPPYNVLNSNGYIVDGVIPSWMFILDTRILMKSSVTIDGVMDSTGRVFGTAQFTNVGYSNSIEGDSTERDEPETRVERSATMETFTGKDIPDLVITKTSTDSIAGADTLKKQVVFHYQAPNTDRIYFLSPFLFSHFRDNPFKDAIRYTDVDFGCNQSFRTRIRLKIPANFTVNDLPRDIFLVKDDSSIGFQRKVRIEDHHLVIEHSFIIKNSIFIKEDYAALKAFFDKLYAILNEDISMKKG